MGLLFLLNLPMAVIIFTEVFQKSFCELYFKNWLICDLLITFVSIPYIKFEFYNTLKKNLLLGEYIVNEIHLKNKHQYQEIN